MNHIKILHGKQNLMGGKPYWERAIGQLGPRERTRSTPFPGVRDVQDEEALKRYQDYLDELEQRPKDVADAR